MSTTIRLKPLTLTAGQYGVILAALELYAEQAEESRSTSGRDMAKRATEKLLAARK